MNIGDFSGRVSRHPRFRGLTAPMGAFVPRGVTAGLAVDSADLTSVWPTAPGLAFATGPQHLRKHYQSMACIAAIGGASGPYPAWDPV